MFGELYELMDNACADALGVSVEEYVQKIEACSPELCEEIILLIIDGNELEDRVKARELFNTIKLN
jgi:hypothetical protein